MIKRKSAFSVYAENKPEPSNQEIQSKLIDTTNAKQPNSHNGQSNNNQKKSNNNQNNKKVYFPKS